MDNRSCKVFTLGLAGIGNRLCFKEQKVVIIINALCTDTTQLLIPQIRINIILKQANITVIGGGHPFFLAVFLNELM